MKIFLPGAGGKALHIINFKAVAGVERVVISEIHPWAYGNFVADASYLLPRFDDAEFLQAFLRVYEKERFDVCIPIDDRALHFFSQKRTELEHYPFRLAMNPRETIDIVSDKLATYDFFLMCGIPTAPVHSFEAFLRLHSYEFPYFLKPRYAHMRGTERQFYMRLDDASDVGYAVKKVIGREEGFIVQRFLHGTEVNIDFFCDANGTVKSVIPLKRLAMGVSRGITRGEIVPEDRFDEYVFAIARHLTFYGANQVQAYVDEDRNVMFTEINGRFSGSSVLVKEAGVDYFRYFVELLQGRDISIKEKPRFLKMTCWDQPFFYCEDVATRIG
jgi:carbamoyl-phosphate synthase large subunit